MNQVKRMQQLAGIIKESREDDAMLEKTQFMRNFLDSIVDGKYGEPNITYQEASNFMDKVEQELSFGESSLMDELQELYQDLRSMFTDERLKDLEMLVKSV